MVIQEWQILPNNTVPNTMAMEFNWLTARAERIPDIVARGGVRQNRELAFGGAAIGPEGFFDIGVSVPLFNRNQGNIAAARAEVDRAQWEIARHKMELARRFAAVYKTYQDASVTATRLQDAMLPKARKAFEMYQTNFSEMAAPHAQVLLTQRSLGELEEQYTNALLAGWRSAVQIDGLLAAHLSE